jgi:ATP-binding cassette subfamily B protein
MKYFKIDFRLVCLLLCNIIISLVSVLFPLSLMRVTDLLVSNDMMGFQVYLVMALALILIQMTMTYLGTRGTNTYIMIRLIEVRNRVMESLLRSEYDKFRAKQNDEYLSLTLTNVQVLENDYYKSVLNVITKAILLLTSLVTLLIMNPILTLILVIIIVIIGTFPLLFSKKILTQKKNYISATEMATRSTTECLYGFEVIKINRIEQTILNKYKSNISEMEQSGRLLGNTIGLANVIFGSSTMLLLLLVFLIGGYSVSQGTLTIGSLIACTQLIMYVLEPAICITQDINTIQSTKPIREQINQIIDSTLQNNHTKKLILDESFHTIKLEDVSYRYPGEEGNVLNHITFTFEAGKKYALVGGNGSGKSTLLKIMSNLITDYTGHIKINEHDYKTVNLDNVGYIDQYNFLFNASIFENIYFSNNDKLLDHDELEELFEKLKLVSCIASHPEGIHFIVGDNGDYLSGGEKQKICIARALLKEPNILLLDEPNSALDTESSRQFDEIIGNLEDILCILVTHKLDESLRDCDEILVLENGNLIESGSYDSLLFKTNLISDLSQVSLV